MRQRVEALADLEVLRFCDRHEVVQLAGVFGPRPVAEGEVLCRTGDEAEDVYLVTRGYLAVVVDDELVATLGRGSVASELAPLGGQPRCADLIAMTDGEVFAAPSLALSVLLADCPGLRKAVTPLLAERAERNRERSPEHTSTSPGPR